MDFLYLDTNAVRNPDVKRFFGQGANYSKIAPVVRIVVPEMVVDEIKQQKKRKLFGDLDKFRTNYFSTYFNCEITQEIKDHVEEKVTELFEAANEEFEFEVAPFDLEGQLETIMDYVVNNRAPFERNSDKGFKDMIIYLSIVQHFERQGNAKAYVITDDGRLKDAFSEDHRFTLLKNVDDFIVQRRTYFTEEYFVGQLNEYFASDNLTANSVLRSDLNDDNNWTLIVKVDNEEVSIIVDYMSREIIDEEE